MRFVIIANLYCSGHSNFITKSVRISTSNFFSVCRKNINVCVDSDIKKRERIIPVEFLSKTVYRIVM